MPDGGPVESSGALALPDGGRLKDKFSEDLSLSCLLQLRYPGRGVFHAGRGVSSEDNFVKTAEISSLISKEPHPGRGTVHPRTGEPPNLGFSSALLVLSSGLLPWTL